jgi:hypothetical protein
MRDQRVVLPAAGEEVDLLDGLDEGAHGAEGTPLCLLETAAGQPRAPVSGMVRRGPSDRPTAHVACCYETTHGRHLTWAMESVVVNAGEQWSPRGEVIASGCP